MEATLYDYVYWRQDLDMQHFPYQEVDYLVLAALAYLPLDGLVDRGTEMISLERVAQLYQERGRVMASSLDSQGAELLRLAGPSKRYGKLRLCFYCNDSDSELIKQFAAVTFVLEDESLVLAYRGTDDTLLGWHEDFQMLLYREVPSQASALQYLEEVLNTMPPVSLSSCLANPLLGMHRYARLKAYASMRQGRPVRLCGHSKGGNLAMYAAIYAADHQKQIVQVYSYDGPGFQEDILKESAYQTMLGRIRSYVPHYAFFGIVLGHEEPYEVVHSFARGMNQHSLYSWEVSPFGFASDELSDESVAFAIKVYAFLENLELAEKEAFIEALFKLFDDLGLKTFSELSRLSFKHYLAALKEISQLSPAVRKNLVQALQIMWDESKKAKA